MRALTSLAFLALGSVLAMWALGVFDDKPPLPRLVANMTGDFYGDDAEFKDRVAATYPSPVFLATLIRDLSEQGFVIQADEASFEDSDIACRYIWRIVWRAEGANATNIKGRYPLTCL